MEDPGRRDGTMESVRLYLIAEEIFWAATWCAGPTLVGSGVPAIVLFSYWWGGPGAVTGVFVTALATGFVFWMTCSGPRSIEVTNTRLRLVDHRGRGQRQFERAKVTTVELYGGKLWLSEHSYWHRYQIALRNVPPRRVLRLRMALERYGWLQPDTGQPAS